MKQLQIAVCEDSIEEQNHLFNMLQDSNFPTNIFTFNCGEDFLKEFQVGKFDLVFMDIYLKGMSGVEAITEIRKLDVNVSIAFTTTSTDHTLESYRLEALKYLEKPVKKKPVQDLLELVFLKKESTPQLILKIKGRTVSIPFERILYVEQKSPLLFVFLTGGDLIQANERLDNIENQFEGRGFLRCHKSFLVNLAYVKALNKNLMVFSMQDGHSVHIRRESMPVARKAFEAYLFKMTREMDES